MSGLLTLVSTPIGNLGDITYRAVEVLREAGLILAEDTRHSRKLLTHYGITTPVSSYHDHNKERVTPGIVERLAAGEKIALVTDAGTPGVSDPGFYLVRAAIEAGIRVTVAPGPSAVLPALVLSGFPTDQFAFVGFTPKKKGELSRTVAALAEERRTTLFYVAPHQLIKVLGAFAEGLPERPLAVAREITKIHEEVVRGTAAELLEHFGARKVRGEMVLVVRGVDRRRSM
jgi:16S rRNA (cytidine1402-2'-O)-methyltransferase